MPHDVEPAPRTSLMQGAVTRVVSMVHVTNLVLQAVQDHLLWGGHAIRPLHQEPCKGDLAMAWQRLLSEGMHPRGPEPTSSVGRRGGGGGGGWRAGEVARARVMESTGPFSRW